MEGGTHGSKRTKGIVFLRSFTVFFKFWDKIRWFFGKGIYVLISYRCVIAVTRIAITHWFWLFFAETTDSYFSYLIGKRKHFSVHWLLPGWCKNCLSVLCTVKCLIWKFVSTNEIFRKRKFFGAFLKISVNISQPPHISKWLNGEVLDWQCIDHET